MTDSNNPAKAQSSNGHASKTPTGVHLVGSIPLSSTEEVFCTVAKTLPGRLHSIPDGETGQRHYFLAWQRARLTELYPELVRSPTVNGPELSEEELSSTMARLDAAGGWQTRYDTYALESYKTFASLRDMGKIPVSTKFQVCLPTPITLLLVIRQELRSTLEPVIQQALLSDLKTIAASIPPEDLAIQFDCPREFAIIEDPNLPFYSPGFTPDAGTTSSQSLAKRISQLVDCVDSRTEVGVHCCYGDLNHKHFVEPKDLRTVVEFVNAIQDQARRNVDFVHMPVPKARTDEAYFDPLKDMKLVSSSPQGSETKVFLGLVHHDDLAGTMERIEAARRVVPGLDFGVATECGMGRTPPEQVQPILDLLAKISSPHPSRL